MLLGTVLCIFCRKKQSQSLSRLFKETDFNQISSGKWSPLSPKLTLLRQELIRTSLFPSLPAQGGLHSRCSVNSDAQSWTNESAKICFLNRQVDSIYLGNVATFEPDQLAYWSFSLSIKFQGQSLPVFLVAPLGYNLSVNHETFRLNTLSLLGKYCEKQGGRN